MCGDLKIVSKLSPSLLAHLWDDVWRIHQGQMMAPVAKEAAGAVGGGCSAGGGRDGGGSGVGGGGGAGLEQR